MSALLRGAVIYTASDDIPTAVNVGKVTTPEWTSSSQGKHDWAHWDEGIVHAPRFLNIAALECELQTAATHAKAHRIHVNVIY
jgi:hypothetical protein